jgi:hypothetical protein
MVLNSPEHSWQTCFDRSITGRGNCTLPQSISSSPPDLGRDSGPIERPMDLSSSEEEEESSPSSTTIRWFVSVDNRGSVTDLRLQSVHFGWPHFEHDFSPLNIELQTWQATRIRSRVLLGSRGRSDGVGLRASASCGKPYLAHNADMRSLLEVCTMYAAGEASNVKSHDSFGSTCRGSLLAVSIRPHEAALILPSMTLVLQRRSVLNLFVYYQCLNGPFACTWCMWS